MSRGFAAQSSSGPRPIFSIVPGRKGSISTSALESEGEVRRRIGVVRVTLTWSLLEQTSYLLAQVLDNLYAAWILEVHSNRPLAAATLLPDRVLLVRRRRRRKQRH